MSYLIRKLMRFSMYIFYIFVKPYSIYFSSKITPIKLPPISNELLRISGVRLSKMIRRREVTCEAVIQAYINRCREVDPFLNAIVEGRKNMKVFFV